MCVIADRRCMCGVVGPFWLGCRPVEESKMISEVEAVRKAAAQKVIPLYT